MQPKPLDARQQPRLPEQHYLDNRIYTDAGIFAAEQREIFGRCWRFVLHASELPRRGSYRLVDVGGHELIVVRGDDDVIRAFMNACPHRGAQILRRRAGCLEHARMTCFYHHWSYSTRGQCLVIPEPAAYGEAVRREDVHLHEAHVAEVHGLVFVSLEAEPPPLETFLGAPMLDTVQTPFGTADLEVFHFHRTELKANWKLFVETNCEGYHELLHVLNRTTGVADKTYRQRSWQCRPGGHAVFEQASYNYERLQFEQRETNTLPGMQPNGHIVVDIFPDLMLNCRSTVVRIDSLIPVSPERTILECRGLAPRADTAAERALRLRHHNQVWGPTGTNLPEDIWAVEAQMGNILAGSSRYSVVAREEAGSMDDEPLRHFYAEWGRRIGRAAHDIDAAAGIAG